MTPRLVTAVQAAVAAILAPAFEDSMRDLGDGSTWDDKWTGRILVFKDGTWCLPGTFASTYGTWSMENGVFTVAVNDDDD